MIPKTALFDRSRIKQLISPACILGEGPMWHSGRSSAFWVDILNDSIFEYKVDSEVITQYKGNSMISLLCQADGNDAVLVVGAQGGVGVYDLDAQELSVLADLGRNWETHRCNDGGVDCLGNLWIGSTHMDHAPGGGDLYRISDAWCAAKKIEQVSISNGMCWSADNGTLYHTDS